MSGLVRLYSIKRGYVRLREVGLGNPGSTPALFMRIKSAFWYSKVFGEAGLGEGRLN